MPAGDRLPTSGSSYALELRGFLAADNGHDGADFWIVTLTGFGDVEPKDQDVSAEAGDGSIGGSDYIAAQPIIATLACHTGSAATAEAAYQAARTAFLPASTDVWLHLWAPEWGHVKLEGRSRGSVPKRTNMAEGVMFAQVTFLALDPTIVPVTP